MSEAIVPKSATWYDHARNHTSAAQGSAVARARRDAVASGSAYTVVGQWRRQAAPFWWNGCAYDALALARELRANGATVRLYGPEGAEVDLGTARY